jgi:hypothetical protein
MCSSLIGIHPFFEALDLAELLTATDVEEEQEEDDEYLSL